ncbi:MAG: 7-cyano-7-deazaguanine synthase [Candidatus Hermodarchaeota archaeon]
MSETKRVAITGANGFLGQHTIKEAKQFGWEVNAIVRREEVIEIVNNLGAKPYIVKGFSIEKLEQAFNGCKAVLHFANIVCGSKELFESINVNGLKNVIEAAKNQSVSRIIYPSGLGVDKIGIEDWASNNYFYSKRKAEQLLQESKVPYIIFRPSYILGPNDELIPEIIEQISNGIALIAGDGKIPMQPIYVKDAVKAFLAAADGFGKDNQIHNLVGPEVIDMNKLVDLVFSNLKKIGINIPKPDINYINYDKAAEKLDICEEMVDIMRCNLIFDGNLTAQIFNYKLTSINEAVKAAVSAKLEPKLDRSEKRAILLLSGGIDSTTTLFWAIKQGYKIITLSMNYQYRPEKEKQAARELAKVAGVELTEVNISFIAQATDLLFEGYPVISALNAPEGYIPLRNLIFYSIAAYYAQIYGCEFIIGGHIVEDPKSFPDSKLSFFKSLEKLILKSKHKKDKTNLKLIFPLAKLNKLEIIKLAEKLNVPIDLTWSCYGDFDEPCGKCKPCVNRNKALQNLKTSN